MDGGWEERQLVPTPVLVRMISRPFFYVHPPTSVVLLATVTARVRAEKRALLPATGGKTADHGCLPFVASRCDLLPPRWCGPACGGRGVRAQAVPRPRSPAGGAPRAPQV